MAHLLKKQSVLGMVGLVIVSAVFGWMMVETGNGDNEEKRPRVIGIMQLTEAIDAFPDGMKHGLRDFGYVEGRDVVYRYENLREDVGRAQEVAQKFVDENVDLMFVVTNPSLAAALEVTKRNNKLIPIVFVGVDKPVETGLIESFTSSGNNSTGIMGSVTDNVTKQLAILREMSPNAKRIGIFGKGFYVPQGIGALQLMALKEDAPKYGFEVVEYVTEAAPEPALLDAEFKRIAAGIEPGDIDALLHIAGHYHPTQQFLEIELAERLKNVVTVEPTIEEVQDGGIMGYAPNLYKVGQDTAVIIDKILRGARPEDVPVEMPVRNELWVNLGAAKRAGVTIPDSVLSKANNRIGE